MAQGTNRYRGRQDYRISQTRADRLRVCSLTAPDLWHVEKSFRMSKTDLAARPMFHRTRDAIEAHLTIVFTALAVAHCIQERSGLAIANVVKQLRPLRSATITINGATQTFPPDVPEPQRKILAALGINMAY